MYEVPNGYSTVRYRQPEALHACPLPNGLLLRGSAAAATVRSAPQVAQVAVVRPALWVSPAASSQGSHPMAGRARVAVERSVSFWWARARAFRSRASDLNKKALNHRRVHRTSRALTSATTGAPFICCPRAPNLTP